MKFATKNLKARCDVALQSLWRYVKDRHRSCDGTWSSGTNLKKIFFFVFIDGTWSSGTNLKKIFFFVFIGSETPRVVTASVAVLDVPPQGL